MNVYVQYHRKLHETRFTSSHITLLVMAECVALEANGR